MNNLISLSITDIHIYSLLNISNLVNLDVLLLKNYRLNNIHVSNLNTLTRLRVLSIDGSIDVDTLYGIKDLTNLRHLNIFDNSIICDVGFDAITNFTKLQELRMGQNSDKSINDNVLLLISQLSRLTLLDLSGNNTLAN